MLRSSAEITALLKRSRSDDEARQVVYELIYSDLRRIAGHRIAAARPGETLSVTSLVNEAYLKLTERTGNQWNDRNHFMRVAATAMRQITIDHVRAKLTEKRGSGRAALPLDDLHLPFTDKSSLILALEEGMQELAQEEPRLIAVIECRFYAGMTRDETAQALEISLRTVSRDWDRAKQWLRDYLT